MAEDRLEKAIAGQTNPEFAAVMVEDLEKNYEQLKTTAEIRECLAEVIENNPKSALLLVNIVGVKEKMAASGQDSFEHKYRQGDVGAGICDEGKLKLSCAVCSRIRFLLCGQKRRYSQSIAALLC